MSISKRVHLQNRDIEIFKICSDLGYVTLKHLVEHGLFKTKDVAAKRLSLLKKAGFLGARLRACGNRANIIYYPIVETYRGLLSTEKYIRAQKVAHFKPWIRSYGQHEDILRSWALRFLRTFDVVQIDLDFMLYNNKIMNGEIPIYMQERLPDMIIEINNYALIYVEIELTQKSTGRYKDKIGDALRRSNTQLVYITDSTTIQSKVNKVVESLRNDRSKNVHVYTFSELKDDHEFRAKISSIGELKVTPSLTTDQRDLR